MTNAPTIVIQQQPNGKLVVNSNLSDPLLTAMYLGMAVTEQARITKKLQMRAVVGPDGRPMPEEAAT